MLNYRHARYVWVPHEPSGALRGADFEERALIVYLAKLVDPETGSIAFRDNHAFRALAMACAVHPHERRAFRDLVPRVLARPGVTFEDGVLTLADVRGWQRTREPSRRVFATEPPDFARLPAFVRFTALELVRGADDRGVVWAGSAETFAHHHACVATMHRRADARAVARGRILDGVRTLISDGFVRADAVLMVRNFEAAQGRLDPTPEVPIALPDGSRTPPRRLEDGSPTAPPRLEDGSGTPPLRLGDGTMRVSVRNPYKHVAEIGAPPTLPTVPTLPTRDEALSGEGPEAPPALPEEGEQLGLFPGMAPPPLAAAARKRKPQAPRADALPFTVADALGAIEANAGGRFTAGDPKVWTRGHCIAIQRHIRRFPVLEEWRDLGRWLAAGHDAWRKDLGPAWAANDVLVDMMVRSQAWAKRRRARPAGPGDDPLAAPRAAAPPPAPADGPIEATVRGPAPPPAAARIDPLARRGAR